MQHEDTGNRILQALSELRLTPSVVSYAYGVKLRQAPQTDSDAFIGRGSELGQPRDLLPMDEHQSCTYVVGVLGTARVDKTQFSLAHGQQCGGKYRDGVSSERERRNTLQADYGQFVCHDRPSYYTQAILRRSTE